ncbi:PAS domain-containing protein [Sansalvadorimonas sp. 2012CJ34-2]|uniref:PAS domain-containing protein n=1 Tax=Parendozoicomonas callyspongiae TaxID=2942213 RepID=A0ABT0PAL0_9GAMM|nr:PAS domain-containing protein [Sansalvadorimonas sp. 2012CJ34-2]MCL6268419.1 PAS domain-containing protein [Sansalvadorimonas sp. 2012CJ34-2]
MIEEVATLVPDEISSWRHAFNDGDRKIIRSMETVVDGIASVFGPFCEVVLHSLEDPARSVVKIKNGLTTTGRDVDSPITEEALKQLNEIAMQEGGDISHTCKRTPDGQLFKSTSMVIRNEHQKPVGMLCININMSVPASEFLQAFTVGGASETPVSGHFPASVDDLVENTVDRTILEVNSNQQLSNKVKNKHIIMSLFDKGIFDIKESVPLVARKLGVSRHTVYLYIRQRKLGES